MKVYYFLGSLGRNHDDDGWHITFYQGMSRGGYDFGWDISKAKRYNSKQELYQELDDNPQLFYGAMLFEYTEEYLERIKDNEKAKLSIIRL